MKLLSINTAFSNSDVALFNENKISTLTLPSSAKQSENILVAIDELLTKNSVDIKDIDTMACVVGPGSFTGVRIGIGLIKGIKMAKKDLKLISICSLDYMAYISKPQACDDFWCVLNALSGYVFACKYNKEGQRLLEPKMFMGEDIEKISGKVFGLYDENMEIATDKIKFDANSLLDYSKYLDDKNIYCEENNFLPIYLRKSQAEAQLDDK